MYASKRLILLLNSRSLHLRPHSSTIIFSYGERCFSSQAGIKKKKFFEQVFGNQPEKTVQRVTRNSKKISELPGKTAQQLTPRVISNILTDFIRKPQVRNLAAESGLTAKQLRNAFVRFRGLCLTQSENKLPVELEFVLNDIMLGASPPDELFRQFMEFARKIYPHLQCREELSRICDLRDPAAWYPQARTLGRKIIYHAGPTNSGKTYKALEKFMSAEKSVYCGPLKMLACEVFNKTNSKGIDCDLATGDSRVYAKSDGEKSDRLSCTVEMAPLTENYDVAVIDEIQMLQDNQRGWAWSRALLGIAASEVHLCGEAAAIPLVKNLLATAGETVEVHNYTRLTPFEVEDSALVSLSNVQPGDCIVCFNKRDLYKITKALEEMGHRVAVIYGSLPPGAKLDQCNKFNNIDDPCNIMVATDAIGMGLNLNIRRIIFVTVKKMEVGPDGKKTLESISVSQALQIAGRAGRYGTQYDKGFVTTLSQRDLKPLKRMLASLPLPAEKAGLYPTAEQIEMFSFHLPESSLQSILEIFTDLCQMDDSLYFMCNIESFMYLAEKMDSIQLPLRPRYIFCCSPVNIKDNMVVSMLLRMARRFGQNKAMNAGWLAAQVQWPCAVPANIADMSKLESLHDVFDLYLWLGLRYADMFQEAEEVRSMKTELDNVIVEGLKRLSQLIGKENAGGAHARDVEADTSDESEEKGSLEEDLVKSGKISAEVLDRLKYEWKQELSKRKDT